MNMTLFKTTLRSNYKLFIIFSAVLSMYMMIMIGMYDPDSVKGMEAMLNTMPDELIKAFNFSIIDSSLLGSVAGMFYGFLIFAFPLVFCIITGNRMIAKHNDKGSMSCILATPITRQSVAVTQALYFIISTIGLILITTLVGILASAALFPDKLDAGRFIFLNLIALLLILAESGICFLLSCIFDTSGKALSYSGGILVGFLLMNMLAGIGDKISWLKNFSLYGIFDAAKIIDYENSTWIVSIVYLLIIVLTYLGGIVIFKKRNLAL